MPESESEKSSWLKSLNKASIEAHSRTVDLLASVLGKHRREKCLEKAKIESN
jgi:hypothetical protein